MLSQENINRALTERVLSKTAGAAHMSKYAENWFTANNNSNLKNVGVGAGVGLAAGAGAYALGGLIPGLKKNRLARAMMALGVGGAAGGAAGYYGTDIRNNTKDLYYGAKNMSPADGQFRQTLQERRAARAADKAERQAQADAMKHSSTPEHIDSVLASQKAYDESQAQAQGPEVPDVPIGYSGSPDKESMDAYRAQAQGALKSMFGPRFPWQQVPDYAAQVQSAQAQNQSKTGSFRGYHPSRNLYMNKYAGNKQPYIAPPTPEDIAGFDGSKGGRGTHSNNRTPTDVRKWLNSTKPRQPATAEEIAAFDGSKGGRGTHSKDRTATDVQAWLDRTKSGKQYPGSGNWFTANNNSNLKDIGIGVGTGALAYGATGLIPSLKKKRLTRALIALTAGGAAGYYGSNMRGQA